MDKVKDKSEKFRLLLEKKKLNKKKNKMNKVKVNKEKSHRERLTDIDLLRVDCDGDENKIIELRVNCGMAPFIRLPYGEMIRRFKFSIEWTFKGPASCVNDSEKYELEPKTIRKLKGHQRVVLCEYFLLLVRSHYLKLQTYYDLCDMCFPFYTTEQYDYKQYWDNYFKLQNENKTLVFNPFTWFKVYEDDLWIFQSSLKECENVMSELNNDEALLLSNLIVIMLKQNNNMCKSVTQNQI